MLHLMIAPSGEAFAPSPENLFYCCDLAPSDRPLVEFAIKNVGAIELRAEAGVLRIKARPEVLTAASIDGLSLTCRSRRVGRIERVVLTLLTPLEAENPPPRIFPSIRSAAEALVAQCKESSTDPSWSSFDLSEFKLENATDRAYDTMHMVVAEWQLTAGQIDEERALSLMRRAVGGANVMVTRLTEDQASVRIEGIRMDGVPWKGWWDSTDHRNDLRNHPDPRYGRWVLQQHKEVLLGRRPRIDRVTATLRLPEAGVHSFDYDRIILPWRRRDGSPVATLVSVFREIKAG